MKHAEFIYRRAITVLKIMLSVSLMLLLVACDDYNDGSTPSTPVFYSPKSDQLLKVYEGENTILEVIIAGNAAGTTQRQDNHGISFQWYRNEEPIDNARGPVYEIENATMDEDYAVYYCTAGNTAGTATSHKFIIQMTPVLSDPVEDIKEPLPTPQPASKPTPTPRPTPTPVPHAHKWVENVRTERTYKTENIEGYKCNVCDYTTQVKEEMEKHVADNPGQEGHKEFEDDIIIGYFYELYSCKCGWEGFTTDDVTEHIAEEWHEIKDGECTAKECQLTTQEHTIAAQWAHTKPEELKNQESTKVDITDTENLVYSYFCTAEECRELGDMTEAGKTEHLLQPGCENHIFSPSLIGYKVMVYKCPDCYIQTTSKDSLKEHFNDFPHEVIHETVDDGTGNIYECLSCGAKFKTDTDGNTHADTHKTGQSWNVENFGDFKIIDVYLEAGSKCKACDFMSKYEAELTKHMHDTTVAAHGCDWQIVVIGTKQVQDGTVYIPTGTYYCNGCGRTR